MKQQPKPKKWTPEIFYEENEHGQQETVPLIDVPKEYLMPASLLVWEHRKTGEFEPGEHGQEIEIVERDLHLYVDMHHMKQKLAPEDLDKIRVSLGMKPLAEAQIAGAAISAKVKQNLETLQSVVASAKEEASSPINRSN